MNWYVFLVILIGTPIGLLAILGLIKLGEFLEQRLSGFSGLAFVLVITIIAMATLFGVVK